RKIKKLNLSKKNKTMSLACKLIVNKNNFWSLNNFCSNITSKCACSAVITTKLFKRGDFFGWKQFLLQIVVPIIRATVTSISEQQNIHFVWLNVVLSQKLTNHF